MRFYDPYDVSCGPHLVGVPPLGDSAPGELDLLVVPTVDLQCVARTKARRRCRNRVRDGRQDRLYGDTTLHWYTHGLITVYAMDGSPEALRVWREQHCPTHDTPDAVDECAVEWRPYSAEQDLDFFLQPIPPLPLIPEPEQEWTEVPEWLLQLWRVGHGQRTRFKLPAGATYIPGRGWTTPDPE